MRGRRRIVLGTLAALVAFALGGAGTWYLASAGVEVVVDGERLATRTLADDVTALLARMDVAVGPHDRVEPALGTPVTDGLRIVVDHAKTVEVVVDDDAPLATTAVVDTVADVLLEVGLAELLDREARIDPAPDAPVADGDRIIVELPVEVVLAVGGNNQQLATYEATVAEALAVAGVTLGERDLVNPGRSAPIDPGMVITVRRVELVEDVVEVSTPRTVVHQETDDLLAGHTQVEVEGQDGLRRKTYRVTLIDGREAHRDLADDELVREAADRVVLVGAGSDELREAQQLLADLGYPVGPVDGIDGAQTRRALCAWRRLEGRDVSRDVLTATELELLRTTGSLPAGPYADRGVTVDRTCQALYYGEDGRWRSVHAASTGADGLPRPDDYRIQRVRPGWHTSTLYPAPSPNMYNSMYIRGAIAIHGSHHVPPNPASKGCVRVTPGVADQLFADLSVGDPVRVIGTY